MRQAKEAMTVNAVISKCLRISTQKALSVKQSGQNIKLISCTIHVHSQSDRDSWIHAGGSRFMNRCDCFANRNGDTTYFH